MKTKNVLLTGSSGFIARRLTNFFLKKGYVVYGLDKKTELYRHYSNNVINKKYFFNKVDLSKSLSVKLIHKKLGGIKFDSVWHFAANSDISKGSKNFKIELNDTFNTSINTINIANELKIPKLIFASTSAIFGRSSKKISEDFGPCLPESYYGAMKLASEGFISSNKNYFNNIIIARFPNVVGIDNTHGLIFDMISKSKKNSKINVLGDGFQKKPYIHVDDLINILFRIYNSNQLKNIEIFNIGPDDKGISVREIISKLQSISYFKNKVFIYGDTPEGWVGDIPKYSYDIRKLLKKINYKPLSSVMAINKTINEIKKFYDHI